MGRTHCRADRGDTIAGVRVLRGQYHNRKIIYGLYSAEIQATIDSPTAARVLLHYLRAVLRHA